MNTDNYWLGVSYYPEQWSCRRWREDFRLMRELGFNTVRMGEFAWAFFETVSGKYESEWMQEAIALAAEYGVKTLLCTPTASPPPWLRKKHPAILGGNELGPFDYGARKGYCVNCPEFIAAATAITEYLAESFVANPEVIGWQLDNEPGYPFVCIDQNCLTAFRHWLKRRYETIAKLNTVWGTSFWSHIYNDWDEIELPFNRPDGNWNPGEKLDYRRFFSDSFASYLKIQANILRKVGVKVPVMTNWPNTFWSVDLFRSCSFLDAMGWDNYGRCPGVTDYRDQLAAGEHHDICRGAAQNDFFIISEQTAQAPTHSPQAGIRLQTLQDIAHGASGTIFFQWRPPRGGAEQGYISVLNPDGSPGITADQFKQLRQDLDALDKILPNTKVESEIAMLISYDSMWDEGFWLRRDDGYDFRFNKFYTGLRTQNCNIDVISVESDLSQYKLIYAPGLRVVSDELAMKLTAWVEAGGVLMLTSMAGAKDEYARLREEKTPGILGRLAGVEVIATASRSAMSGNLILGNTDESVLGFEIEFSDSGQRFNAWDRMDRIKLTKAVPIAVYRGGQLGATPAITSNYFGKGIVIFCGTDAEGYDFHQALAENVVKLSKITFPLKTTPGIICSSLKLNDGGTCIFAINYTANEGM
ncbi:MAG: beta-galactosidase, partial [Victivallales bacterium]|nr:beta-galactosidase [Victivallales bacterium]